MMISKKIALIGCTILTGGVGSVSAFAQTSPGGTPTTASGSQTGNTAAQPLATETADQVEDIIVTAQRTSASLQRTPISVTAFSGKDIDQAGSQNLRDLMLSTPNLQQTRPITGQSTAAVFFLRGLGIPRGALGVQPAVGLYIDDFYYPSGDGGLLRLLDLNSVEVLRGPQGTLFGRNTLGGAIRYNTNPPSTTAGFTGHLDVTGGSFNHIDVSGVVNVPVTSNLALRLTGARFDTNGYIKDLQTGKTVGNVTNKIGRAQLRFTPNAMVTDDLVAEYSREDDDGSPYILSGITSTGPGAANIVDIYNNGRNLGFIVVPPAPAAFKYDSRYVTNCQYCQPGTNLPDYSINKNFNAHNTLTVALSDALTAKLLTGYFNIRSENRIDLDRTPVYLVESLKATGAEEAFSQEVQAQGHAFGERLHFITGLYFYHYSFLSQRFSTGYSPGPFPTYLLGPVPVPALPKPTISTLKSDSYAAYTQFSLNLTDKLTAILGGRYSRDEVTVTTLGSTATAVTLRPDRANFENFSPAGKLQYQWTSDIMTYASISKGFRGGAVNTETQLQPALGLSVLKPDILWSYEVGARTALFDRHVQINLTGFTSDYKGIQLLYTYPLHFGGVVPPVVYFNGGDATVRGLEFESQASFGRFRLRATAAYLDAHYTKITPPGPDTTGAVPVPVNSPITLDSEFQHAPPFTYSLGGSYTHPLDFGSLRVALDYSWQAHQYSTAQLADAQRLPSYGILNFRANLDVGDHVTLSAGVTNVLNKYYLIGGADTRSVLGPAYLEPGAPREWSASLRFKF